MICSSPIIHRSVFFSVTSELTGNEAKQLPFLRDLHIGPDLIVHVEKRVGDFVMLAVNARRSGYAIIAKDVKGAWVKIWEGQDEPLCTLTEKWKVPTQITSCYR